MTTKRIAYLSAALAAAVVTLLVTLLGLNAGSSAYAMPILAPLDAHPASSPQKVNAGVPTIGGWILVANAISSNLSVIDPGTGVAYGPLLDGQLGTDGGGRFDIAVTPDGQTALISNFGDRVVYLVDIADPIHPSVITSVTLPFFAEDIDISADGQYALVADGGFSPRLASIDIPAATLVYTAELDGRYANAVAIAPDGTIIVADYFAGAIHTLLLGEMGVVITNGNTYTYTYPGYAITDTNGWPRHVNVGVAPDGQTVIVCDVMTDAVGIYQIIAPGVLTFTGVVTGLQGTFERLPSSHGSVQSVAFAGDKAYAVVNSNIMSDITGTNAGDRLAVLNIAGPGQVSLEAGGVATVPHHTSSQLFGVDTVAVAGDKVYMGYPTLSSDDQLRPVAIVDLTDYSVTTTMALSVEVSCPTGVTAMCTFCKSVNPSSARPGEAITYTISFTNTNALTHTDVMITDTLSANIFGDSFTNSGIALTQVPGSRYVWMVPILPPNEGGVITITGVLTKPLAAGTLPNRAELEASGVVAIANANLRVLNVAPVANAGPDQNRRLNSTVTLDGSGSTDENGEALTYNWTQTGGPAVTFTPDLSVTTFTAPNMVTVLTFTLAITDAGGLTSSDEVVVTVMNEADLSVTEDTVRTASAITYTIVVRNLGPDPANDAVVSGTFSAGVTNITWSCVASGGATCGGGTGNVLTDTLTSFPSGGVVTYTVRGTLGLVDTGNNEVTVALPPSGVFDPNLLDNRAGYTILQYLLPVVSKN